MRPTKYFLSVLSVLLLIVMAPTVAAHMLFTYKTSTMEWRGEKSSLDDGTPVQWGLVANETFQFDISLTIPDYDFNSMNDGEVITARINDLVTDVNSSGLFEQNTIEHSTFWFLAYKYDGHISTEWNLMMDVATSNLPDGGKATALFYADNNSEGMSLIVDDQYFTRLGYPKIVDFEAGFSGTYQDANEHPVFSRFNVKPIAVPEPFSLALFLLGMTGLFVARKVTPSTPPRK